MNKCGKISMNLKNKHLGEARKTKFAGSGAVLTLLLADRIKTKNENIYLTETQNRDFPHLKAREVKIRWMLSV